VFEGIIDPTVGPATTSERDPAALAARPASLSGLRLGLLANTKRNAEEFLTQVGRELAEQYGVQTVLARKKPNIVETAPEPMMAELRAECDVVVTGVGDCGSCSASAVADGLAFEAAGIPAAVICSEAFAVSANAMANVMGEAGYVYVTTAHPVAPLTPPEVRERARIALPEVVSLLTVAA